MQELIITFRKRQKEQITCAESVDSWGKKLKTEN